MAIQDIESLDMDRYLSSLLAFVPTGGKGIRRGPDYMSLIHAPADGPERVYSLVFGKDSHRFTLSRFREAIWSSLEKSSQIGVSTGSPEVDVVQTEAEASHPVFEILTTALLEDCETDSLGGSGLDYYMLMWQKDGLGSVVACWEPFGRQKSHWITLIGALEVLASQYEFACSDAEL
ncbi:MAG: hypothetical protein CMI15_15195 [Opitutaceae bacterium]|nr:hypothetical protein [Opitutaceae bacterium]